jgi:transposase
MVATFQIPLDIPDVEILSTQVNPKGDLIIEIKSTLSSTRCRRCGKEITRFHGYDKAIRLRHLPILEQKVFIRIQPKRYQCPHCSGGGRRRRNVANGMK